MLIKNDFTIDEYINLNDILRKKYKILFLIISISSFIAAVASFVIYVYTTYNIFNILLLIFTVLFIFFGYLTYSMNKNSIKRRILKTNKELSNGIEYDYTFNVESMNVISKSMASENKKVIKYDQILKSIIKDEYIFIFINKRVAYPIKIKELKENELKEIKNKLNIA